ncbi:MAG: hypothetical protein ACOXZR_01980 [Bacilli bacterium]
MDESKSFNLFKSIIITILIMFAIYYAYESFIKGDGMKDIVKDITSKIDLKL